MLLTIDVGNTNIKLGIFYKEKLINITRLSTDRRKTADEFSVDLYTLFKVNGIDSSKISGCIISSVVPQVTSKIKCAVKRIIDINPIIVGPGIKTGLNIKIDDPSTLGADLVVGCVAASNLCDMPCIVISMGTATAMCVLDSDKSMKGGLIAPGVSISLDALTNSGALLPSVALDAPDSVIGTSTDKSIRAGVVIGSACMIDGLIDKIETELNSKCTIIATGGLADTIIKNCKHKIIVKDDLLLQGLRMIYNKNS